MAAVKEEAEREAERIVNEAKEEAGRIIADAKNRQKKDKTQEETKVEEQRRRISSVPDLAEVEKRETA